MNSLKLLKQVLFTAVLSASAAVSSLAMQADPASSADASSSTAAFEDSVAYAMAAIVIAVVAGGILMWRRIRPTTNAPTYSYENSVQAKSAKPRVSTLDDDHVDMEQELEWFRKAKRSSERLDRRKPKADRRGPSRRLGDLVVPEFQDVDENSARAFQEKMRRIQYAQLPINSFIQLTDARDFDKLPISADPALLSAIEQAQEEYEEDETVRELALKILAVFRSRNSVEALSQMALYDLSSNLRSRAVAILTDFDHESVFETILLACADPTREVRAAAARGLFRLSFDRAEAWKRLMATEDRFRMSHAVRAAIESGIVQKSFDRLLSDDMKIAYEAFVLVALVIRSGEFAPVFDTIRNSRDDRVKMALLHVLSVVKDPAGAAELESLTSLDLSKDVGLRLKETIDSYHQTAVA